VIAKAHPYVKEDKYRDKNSLQRIEEKRKLRRAQEKARKGKKKKLDKNEHEKKLIALRRHRSNLGAFKKSGKYRSSGYQPDKARDASGTRSTKGY
jgi:hypothetical protein